MDNDQHNVSSNITTTTNDTEEKAPHEASIFVGSLPSNVDQRDLSRLLIDHLSEHTQIQNVKVVRDSKGGVCAFVQCSDANTATSLIETLYADPPKPFLGRILRYEPARAFRTLIISYRAPVHLGPVNHSSASFKDQSTEMELPTAMRIWKHRNAKFHSILYNTQALRVEENQSRSGTSDTEGAFLSHPVRFEEESLRDLVTYFGPLESFRPIEELAGGQYPIPHNGPRSTSMDSRCWEVKWKHRDECVSALMTLRRVPHLVVTWAHQPVPRSPSTNFPGSRSFPLRPHQDSALPEFMSPEAFPCHTGSHLFPENIDCQFVGQKYGPQVKMRCDVPASRDLGHKHSFRGRPEYFQPRNGEFMSPSLDKGTQGYHLPSANLDAGIVTPRNLVQTPSTTSVNLGSQFANPPSGTSHEDTRMRESNFMGYGNEKQVDPTTLFVGGLETTGPGAWDEEKVRMVFSKYEGLESVNFVRPVNATVAFAFIKFNNVDAPARAVQEEHNRVYDEDGRTLRVQLRDINPLRGSWKFGRGRGKFQYNPNIQRRYEPDHRPFIGAQDNTAHGAEPSCSMKIGDRQFVPSETPHHRSKSVSSKPEMIKDTPGTEKFREWYDGLESPHTPVPSSKGSSASVTCASFTAPSYPLMHNVPYIPPPPWMQPYVPNPYPLPYYQGYYPSPPPVPQPAHPPAHASASSSEANMGPLAVWPSGMYGSFVSYPIGPLRQVSQSGPNQPPLTPSGFIQNEHGALVAVYQPEALNRYMTGSVESVNVARHETHTDVGQVSTVQHGSRYQGQINTPAFHRVSSQGVYPGSTPHRGQHYNHYDAGNSSRSYTGRPGRGYSQRGGREWNW